MRRSGLTLPRLLSTTILVGSCTLLTVPGSAPGQTGQAPAGGQSGALDEIVVTAEHHASWLQDTPISLSAFTSQKLDQEGIKSVDDISRMTPGLTLERVGETSASNYNDENTDIAIRGIDSNAGSATTALYIDDVPIQTRHLGFGTVNAYPALFDLNRVEVLRGPQGTLFGASSEGGAVRFITPDPSLDQYKVYGRAEVATTEDGSPTYETALAVGGPIETGTLGFRASASFRHDGGYVDRVSYDPATLQTTGIASANSNWENTSSAHLAVMWAPNDNFTLTTSFMYQHLYLNDTAAFWPQLSNTAKGQFNNGNVGPDKSDDPFYLSEVKAVWALDDVTLTSITSAFIRNQSTESDYTQFDRAVFAPTPYIQLPGDKGTSYFKDQQRNYMQEFRAESNDTGAPLTWTAGLYGAYTFERLPQWIYDRNISAESNGLLPPVPGGMINYNSPFYDLDRSLAAYVQGDYKILPTLKLTVGLRVSEEATRGEEYLSGPFIGPVEIGGSGSFSSTPVTPKFGLSYQPDGDELYYTTVAKGYRTGGINPGLGQLCAADLAAAGLDKNPPTYQNDSLWSYELGTKTSWLGNRLQINGSTFYIDWQNIQQNVYLASCGQQFTANLGSATSKGGDLSVNFRPVPSLTLGVEGGYADVTYTQTSYAGQYGRGTPLVSKGDLVNPVPWTFNASAEFSPDLDLGGLPYLRVDYQHAAGQDGPLPNQDPNNSQYDATVPRIPSIDNVNLRLGYRVGGLDISLFADNLLDSHPIVVVSHDTLASPLYFDRTLRPLTVGMTTTFRL